MKEENRGIPLAEWVKPRTEKAMQVDFPGEPFLGLDDIEAHTTRLLGSKPSGSMKSAAKRFYPGDVLYSRLRPYLNKVWLADRSGLCSSEFIVLPSNEHIAGAFLKYRLNARDFVSFANSLNAGDRPRVDFDQISAFCLPPFSLGYQRKLVAQIEELFSELEAGEESLRVARRQLGVFRQSLLKQAFEGKLTETWRTQNPDKLESEKSLLAKDGREKPQIEALPLSWEPCYMKDFVSIERGRFSVRPRGDPRYYGGDTPFVQIGDLPREGGTITSYKQTLNEAGLGVSKLFRKGTPLIAIVGATIGNTGILGFDSCCPDSVVALVSSEPITGKFVELYFRAHKDRIRSDSYSSGGQPNINNAYLERQLIGVPPLTEQQEIVRMLDEQFEAIERNERELDAALQRSEALRQSILKKAFAGRLVKQDPTDEPASVLLARLRTERATTSKPTRARSKKTAVAR